MLDLRSRRVLRSLGAPTFEVGGAWAAAGLAPGGGRAAAPSNDGAVFIWDTATGALEATLRRPGGASASGSGAAAAAAWAPAPTGGGGGARLAAGDRAGGVALWGDAAAVARRAEGLAA